MRALSLMLHGKEAKPDYEIILCVLNHNISKWLHYPNTKHVDVNRFTYLAKYNIVA